MKKMKKMKKLVAVLVAIAALGCGWASFAGAESLGFYQQGGVTKLAGPAYDWWYGCSPTSAGMMMGYYDQKGYGGLNYNKLVPGGVAEATTFPIPNNWSYLANTTIASWGYVTDFYRYANGTPDYNTSGKGASSAYGVSGDDQARTHTSDCLADFMGTSQWALGNVNGSTTFYYYPDGTRLYAKDVYNAHITNDGMLGMDEYFRFAGYGTGDLSADKNFYTQAIKKPGMSQGFAFADYKDDGSVKSKNLQKTGL